MEMAFKPSRKGLTLVGTTRDNVPVFDRPQSHLQGHGMPEEVLKEALAQVSQHAPFEKHVLDMGRIVGNNTCVQVGPEDQVVMAVRKRRFGPTPMVLGRQPEPCSKVVVVLKKAYDDEGEYFVLITAFVGEGSEPEPWDRQLVPGSPEHRRAVRFWQTHALLYDEEVIDYIV